MRHPITGEIMFQPLEEWELSVLQECPICGAAVRHTDRHESWHAALTAVEAALVSALGEV